MKPVESEVASSPEVKLSQIKLKSKLRNPGTPVVVGLIFVFLLLYFIAIAYPLFWMVINSFKNTADIFNDSWGLPKEWLFSNYATAWQQGVSSYFVNSVIITVGTCLLTVLISALCAFGLTRFQIKGGKFLLLFVSAGLMFSPQSSLIPLYELIQQMGIFDTHWALILTFTAYRIPLTVLLIRSFFLSIPKELEESAYLDGATSLDVFGRIFMPMSKPILFTGVILTAYYAWNEFLFSLIFIQTEEVKPITSGLLVFKDALNTNWGVLMAGLVISALPLIVVFMLMQKYFVRGLADGSVKG
ncbi:raffinose/stachyose/melibiose transport system permease protein [Neobacillus niacini]|jgi:raffinose/stachyose/melibiose transport system permease protein|uniref:carbohydrate ABC transporter permease n=1 Tax=Neobacillus niacini TaxID=86668 RepID=UPI0027872434|nr:carbohydrate ABC transporter permease [Neobacillus niacini]MDQ1000208.1 raffinose/stachyose/melibiose transport system permease protein [Neobacillus niacini]